MIAELGHYALVLALALALAQTFVPLIGAARNDLALIGVGRSAACAQFLLLSVSFGALLSLFALSDFSVEAVARYSHSTKPMLYKLSGAWGNHEGSLLMWVWILALFGAAVAVFGANLPPAFRARVLAVQASIGVGFLLFMLFTSNPFLRLDPAPLDGQGLNPILQDPGLAFHPPMLYVGYVGFSMAFAFAVAALIEGRVDASWARWVRPWTLAAWVSLTLGIALGSWWAYYELGWGGWWFWDPVENASFMPWLAGTALLHSAVVVEKRDALKSWTILLAILTFSLSLLGTFLVRSGVLTSVHAFATDPERGVFILMLLAIAVGGSLTLYAWRAPRLQGGGLFQPVSREGGLVLNNMFLATATATVFLGTLYPLFLELVNGAKISVGPPYYNATFVPLMTPLMVLVPIGAMMAWKRADIGAVLGRLQIAVLLTLAVVLGVGWIRGVAEVGALFGFALAAWVFLGSLVDWAERVGLFRIELSRSWARAQGLPRSAYAMTIAHIGLGVMIAGITASSAWQSERILTMAPGDEVELAGHQVVFDGVADTDGANYTAQQGGFSVFRDGEPVAQLFSEKRFYPVERQNTTEAGIDTGLLRDLYMVLGDQVAEDRWNVRLYHNPLVFWIWGGAGIMAFAGLISLSDRRLRVGVPERSRKKPIAGKAEATA
ncbi:MAG: heme lyase CcmF/NrfE family subunit [Geminicoccaceae bacterium]